MNLRLEEYKVQLRKKLMKIDKKISYFVTICVWAMKKPYKGATSIAEMYDSDEVHQNLVSILYDNDGNRLYHFLYYMPACGKFRNISGNNWKFSSAEADGFNHFL